MSDTKPQGDTAKLTRDEKNPFGTPAKHKGKLNKFTLVSIYILAAMGLACGFLLLFGEFEGKFIRVAATLFLFVVFTIFVAKDTNSNKPFLAVPIALAGNIYLLSVSLLLIWATLGIHSFESVMIFPKLIGLIIAIKVATGIVQYISYLIFADQTQLSFAAKLTTVALVITALLYTLPLGLDHLLTFPEFYWKFAVFSIIISGLTLSITALLFWSFKDKLNPVIAKEFGSLSATPVPRQQAQYNNNPRVSSVIPTGIQLLDAADRDTETNGAPTNGARDEFPRTTTGPVVQSPVTENPSRDAAKHKYSSSMGHESVQSRAVAPQQPVAAPVSAVPQASAPGLPVYTPVAVAPLNWPVFPDGSPVPANASGRPDFRALESMAARLKELENRWTS